MPKQIPDPIKVYHVLHGDRLASVLREGGLFCDSIMSAGSFAGTQIGMSHIKERRRKAPLKCHPGLHVGECVPFYFCPRSVMLFLLFKGNHPEITYQGGQEPIVHLEADFLETVQWAIQQKLRWAFTLSNAGSRYFEVRCELNQLNEVDWAAVQSTNWQQSRDAKQAEFLMEKEFPWHLVERIGVFSGEQRYAALQKIEGAKHRLLVEIRRDWYY